MFAILRSSALGQITEAHFDKIFGVNVKGHALYRAKGAAAHARRRFDRDERFDNFDQGHAGLRVYAATKAAVRSFDAPWSVDLKDRQIRVNVVT